MGALNNITGVGIHEWLNLLIPGGAIIGCLAGCLIANKYGRRRCIFVMNVVSIIGSAMVKDI